MRATINGIQVEGTPEEVATFIRLQKKSDTLMVPNTGSDVKSSTEEDSEDYRFASEKIAYRALSRRSLSSAQRKLFKALLNQYPEWTTSTNLQEATKYNPNQLGGLLGAIGRRLSQTDGYVSGSSLIEWMWDADSNEYAYRLPSTVRHALERLTL